MNVTFGQKIQLAVIFTAVNVLWFIDDFVSFLRFILKYSVRVGMATFIISVFLTGFYLKGNFIGISNLPLSYNQVESKVLGVSTTRGINLVNDYPLPEITAKSVYAVDINTGKILLDLHSEEIYPPASVTKLMTALVSIDLYDMDEKLTVPEYCTKIEGQKAGFLYGDTYSVKDLLYSMLISSSADAACTLSVGKLPYSEFIELMNTRAKEIGMRNTFFTNPIGLDGENNSHYSTAKDLYLLSAYATSNSLIKEIVKIKEATIYGDLGIKINLVNTNDLLWSHEGVVGIKTGRTEGAGEVLAYEYEDDNLDVIITLLQSLSRFEDADKILDWLLASYATE